MKHKLNKSVLVIASIVILGLLAACGSEDSTNNNEEVNSKTIEMGQISWAENIAVTNMWKVILEEEGYKVNFNLLDMGTTMAALANNELDVSLEVWLPVQDASYLEQYNEQVNFSEETWYDNAKVGLVVPEYMDEINSIEDLNKHHDLFEGAIVGFDPGAGTMEVTEDVITEYELNYELLPSSEPAMVTEIKEAIEAEEPIVSPLWNPHRIFSEVDLKYLEDPKEVYGGVEKIHHATRQGFEEDFSEVDRWLKNWKMDDEQIGTLMSYVADAEEPIEGAKKWVEENEAVINEWVNK
ncbi:glycine betaine ABC transporter substrate-binding protein [Pseudogracilibacillus sp. SO30301A]|uniref:glycine betaine ABC transporter substrate-binding protein n=1 Tax=Pseudogracilibacillus sp. SO30301A TaxID=3098291 RepID=UPI00300E3DD8